MKKPEKPQKKIEQRNCLDFPFNFVSKKVSWDYFQDWVKENIPSAAKDITVELREDWEYDSCITSLEFSWLETVENSNYEKDMKKYKTKLNKWKKNV